MLTIIIRRDVTGGARASLVHHDLTTRPSRSWEIAQVVIDCPGQCSAVLAAIEALAALVKRLETLAG